MEDLKVYMYMLMNYMMSVNCESTDGHLYDSNKATSGFVWESWDQHILWYGCIIGAIYELAI